MNIFVLLGILAICNGKLGKADGHKLVAALSSQSTVLQQNLKSTNEDVKRNFNAPVVEHKNHKPDEHLPGNSNSSLPPRTENNLHKSISEYIMETLKSANGVNANNKEQKVDYKIYKPEEVNKIIENIKSYIPPQNQKDLHKHASQLPSIDKINENNKEHKINEIYPKTDDKSVFTNKQHEINENENINKYFARYRHSEPHAIDDPLPEKVNYVFPVTLDFQPAEVQLKPLFIPAFAPSHLIPKDVIEPSVDKYQVKANCKDDDNSQKDYKTTVCEPNPSLEQSERVPAETASPEVATKSSDDNVYDPDMKYPGEIKTGNAEEDIVFINHHHGPKTDFELFNSHESYSLSLQVPEVIYKAGDDTSFADDKTVFDDYNHTFPPTDKDAQQSVDKSTVTTKTESATSDNDESAASSHSEEVSNSDHGYFYKKPDIPFES